MGERVKMSKENKMHKLAKKYGTDKVTRHNYHNIFPFYIEKFYDKSGGMIEIGLKKGASLRMHLHLFPKMHVYGLDIDPKQKDGDRHTIIKCDQSLETDLKNAMTKIKHPIYYINDDGSHIPEHQVLTFNVMFPKLESGGVYIIEDIETSYWKNRKIYGRYDVKYGIYHPKNCIEIFKKVVDGVNNKYSKTYSSEIHHQEKIHSVTFAENCIIIIKK
tara:strand:- start:207 stop:857 length:651 start_codon:yes stop_codon:yes gene_type:complete